MLSEQPLWVQAASWGLLGGSALVIGALIGYCVRLPQRLVAGVMAFGSGVLISALAFELMDQAIGRGGLLATASGFVGGALVYTGARTGFLRIGAPGTANAQATSSRKQRKAVASRSP